MYIIILLSRLRRIIIYYIRRGRDIIIYHRVGGHIIIYLLRLQAQNIIIIIFRK